MAPGELEEPPPSLGGLSAWLEGWGMRGAGIAPSLQPRGGRSKEFICAREPQIWVRRGVLSAAARCEPEPCPKWGLGARPGVSRPGGAP